MKYQIISNHIGRIRFSTRHQRRLSQPQNDMSPGSTSRHVCLGEHNTTICQQIQPRKVTWNLPLRKEKHLLQTINFESLYVSFQRCITGILHQHHQKHLQILQGNSCCRPFLKKNLPNPKSPKHWKALGKKNKNNVRMK